MEKNFELLEGFLKKLDEYDKSSNEKIFTNKIIKNKIIEKQYNLEEIVNFLIKKLNLKSRYDLSVIKGFIFLHTYFIEDEFDESLIYFYETIKQHPLEDGNKRLATWLFFVTNSINSIEVSITEKDLFNIIKKVALEKIENLEELRKVFKRKAKIIQKY